MTALGKHLASALGAQWHWAETRDQNDRRLFIGTPRNSSRVYRLTWFYGAWRGEVRRAGVYLSLRTNSNNRDLWWHDADTAMDYCARYDAALNAADGRRYMA